MSDLDLKDLSSNLSLFYLLVVAYSLRLVSSFIRWNIGNNYFHYLSFILHSKWNDLYESTLLDVKNVTKFYLFMIKIYLRDSKKKV